MIEVVSAVIVRNGRILLTQRPANKAYPFAWECPGGKVDGPHESHHSALTRELREELATNVDIPPGTLAIWCGTPIADRPDIFLLMYPVNIHNDVVPLANEGQGIGWFTCDEMRRLPLLPGNIAALEEIVNHAMSHARFNFKESL
jgi:8-oxo-dGTP pyrophosphatase MutT (NUDIX family)